MDTHPVPWAGRNHLALITDNLERATRLWHGVMGVPLVATLGIEAFRRLRRGARSDRGLLMNITATRSTTSPSRQGHQMRGLCRLIMSCCLSPTRPPCTGCGSASWRTAARSRR